jgi:hypothetical protein
MALFEYPSKSALDKRIIEILRIKSYKYAFYHTLDVLVSCERKLEQDISLRHEIVLKDLVLNVDPNKESLDIESSISSRKF